MNTVENAIKDSEDRKARLAKALEVPAVPEQPVNHVEKLGEELNHMEGALKPHGLSVMALLRSVAKNFHGVDVPVYVAPKEEE
jgi:hypothetical protein